MRQHEEHGEPVMRQETDVPRILDHAGWVTRCKVPPGVDAEIRPSENEDRVHMTQHVKGEIYAGGDLEGAEAVAGCGCQTPDEEDPSANLEEYQRHQQR